jgi:hypothetical protein
MMLKGLVGFKKWRRAMDNLVSINRNKFLGEYIDARNGELIPEGAYFCAGVFFSVLLPQFTLFVYGGFAPLIAFAACALAGSLLGVVRYRSPYEPPSCVEIGAESRKPPRQVSSRKRA